MSEFKFSCPNCQQNISATPEYSGMQINCPSCQTALVVPPAPGAPPAVPAGPRLSMAAPPPPEHPAPAAAPKPNALRPVRKKKPKTGLIVGICCGVAALAAAICFWPKIMKMVSHSNQKLETADLTPTNLPPPPPPELSTQEIIDKVADAYKSMIDYAAKAKMVADIDESALLPGKVNVRLTTTSSMQLGRSNNYRLEWEMAVPSAPQPFKGVAWNAGKGNYVGYGAIPPTKVKTREAALTPPSIQAFVLSPAIAELFFSTTNSVAEAAQDFTKTNGLPISGPNCYVLTGEANHQNVLLWVSKENFLIYQIEVILGGKIDEAELKKLPSDQRKEMQALSKLKGTITETYDNIQTNKNLLASAFETSYKPAGTPGAAPRRRREGSMAGKLAQPGMRRQRQPQ